MLVVDDHATYLKALEAVLATECSIDVVGRAENGREAIALALSLDPDVIVLDIRMPGSRVLRSRLGLSDA